MKRKIIEYLKTLPENVVNNDIVSLGNLDLLDLDIFYGFRKTTSKIKKSRFK